MQCKLRLDSVLRILKRCLCSDVQNLLTLLSRVCKFVLNVLGEFVKKLK